MSWLKKESQQPDNFHSLQAKSYTHPVHYETGIPRCTHYNETLINQRCVPHHMFFGRQGAMNTQGVVILALVLLLVVALVSVGYRRGWMLRRRLGSRVRIIV